MFVDYKIIVMPEYVSPVCELHVLQKCVKRCLEQGKPKLLPDVRAGEAPGVSINCRLMMGARREGNLPDAVYNLQLEEIDYFPMENLLILDCVP